MSTPAEASSSLLVPADVETNTCEKLFVLGAHTVLLQRTKQSSGLSTWLAGLTARKRKQVATVALANKMARMVWAVLFKGEAYRPPLVPQQNTA